MYQESWISNLGFPRLKPNYFKKQHCVQNFLRCMFFDKLLLEMHGFLIMSPKFLGERFFDNECPWRLKKRIKQFWEKIDEIAEKMMM